MSALERIWKALWREDAALAQDIIDTLIRPPRVIYAEPEPDTARHGAKLKPTGAAQRAGLLRKQQDAQRYKEER